MKLGPFVVHPAAVVFPLMEGEDFQRLASDVKARGLQEPIVLTHDERVLVDGRNRLRACHETQTDPRFRTLPEFFTEEDILRFIVAANVERRHLDAGQRNMVGADLEPMFAKAAKQRQGARTDLVAPAPTSSNGKPKRARDEAAKAVGASGRGVQQAKRVKQKAPELAAKVKAGEMTLKDADRQVAADERRRRTIATEAAPKVAKQTVTLFTDKGDAVEYPQPKTVKFTETRGDGVSWAHWTWNPVTGCRHGCEYCYAREIAHDERTAGAFPVGFEPLFHHERLVAPANTPIPKGTEPHLRRVFVCSMADLYGGWVPDAWIDQVHAACIANPQWQYILLTKYPKRYLKVDLPRTAWVGTSVDEQKRVKHAEDTFRQIEGVAVKWLSLEPLRTPLQFTDLSVFDWVVIGAQTKTRQPTGVVPAFAPPFDWVRDLVTQAREAGCRVHLKPNLLGQTHDQSPGMVLPNEYPDNLSLESAQGALALPT